MGIIEQQRSRDVMEEFLEERDKSGYKKAEAAELDEYHQILQLFLKGLKARPEESDPLNLESDKVIRELVETLLDAVEPKNDNGEGKPK
ncbi:uncharacterized protein LOC132302811 isoform X2 [Cornus florida]|uniref:uncharacterized protein LOC132302811 isoform X2 n=1 Tax=Cornus florida TaxID=4283 RepID=UPI00289E579A|nr:uncharacterized protein LOC132302811 isoform X2 [Cornus florida]